MSATCNGGGAAGITYWEARLKIKGTSGSTYGDDLLQAIANTNGSCMTFSSRIVVVASGDADKTAIVEAKPVGASATAYSSICAIRIA